MRKKQIIILAITAIVLLAILFGARFTAEKQFVRSPVVNTIATSTDGNAEAPVLPTPTSTVVRTPVRAEQSERSAQGVLPSAVAPRAGSLVSTEAEAESPRMTFQIGSTSYAVAATAGEDLFSVMRQLASTTDFSFTAKEYPGMGYFIESLNGRANANGFYWTLYLNGTQAQKGAAQTIVSATDRVEWRYEKD